MDRKGNGRPRHVNLRAVGREAGDDSDKGPAQQVVGVGLGHRVSFTEQAEIWTMRGYLRDGMPTRDDVGEMSFIMLPGEEGPATAVVGFVAPAAPYTLALGEDAFAQQLRAMVVQLGYDIEGYYASVSLGGRALYFEDVNGMRR